MMIQAIHEKMHIYFYAHCTNRLFFTPVEGEKHLSFSYDKETTTHAYGSSVVDKSQSTCYAKRDKERLPQGCELAAMLQQVTRTCRKNMKKRIERLRGMRDLLPDAYQQQCQIIERLQTLLSRAGYDPVEVPILERSDLFLSSFRQELWQNIYTFRLHNHDHCLRPEYTASICRLFLDHYQKQPLPLRFQYTGPVFRYETPGRGRYRQHTQVGIELFGGQPLYADAEILQLTCDVLRGLEITDFSLELGHIGVASNFFQRLQLDEQAIHLLLSLMEQISRSEEGEQQARERLEALYPERSADEQHQLLASGDPAGHEDRYVASLLDGMSVAFADDGERREFVERFTWKMGRSEQRRQILHALDFLRELHAVAGAPPTVFVALRDLLDRYKLDARPLRELEQLVQTIEQSGVPGECIRLNLALGRGVSYYTGLVFEVHAHEADGFDTQICGGGRYDQLVRAVGGTQDIKACGFAFGIERLQALLAASTQSSKQRILVVPVSSQDLPYALQVAQEMRSSGRQAELDVTGHGVGAGLKLAQKKEFELVAIVGENERREGLLTLHDLRTGLERQLASAAFAQGFDESER
jgi:histidyl-tRNA synthetase